MKISALRTFMRRHGIAGIPIVGIPLALHHLWSRHRRTTMIGVGSTLLVGGMVFACWKSAPHPKISPIVLPPQKQNNIAPVSVSVAPHGTPLFSRTKKILRADDQWSWGDWDHSEYGWISDTELFFAEAIPKTGQRVSHSHLYRYNLRTGRKTHLKRLESLIDCFYHSQVEISPNGKWLLWHGWNKGHETLDAATLDGRHHRYWAGGYWTSHRLVWTRANRHWIEFQDDGYPSYRTVNAIVHDVNKPNDNRRFPISKESFESNPGDVAVDESIVTIGRDDPQEISGGLSVTTASLPPYIKGEQTTKISLPANLPNPNITLAILSPDAKRIAMIVGYGDRVIKGEVVNDLSASNAPNVYSVYYPRSVFTRTDANAKLRSYCILVCRIDGSGMHEVGTWQEEVNPNIVLDVENLRWLPSGRSLSFFCNDVMYTVPAD